MTCSCDKSKPWKQATCTDHGIEKKTRPKSKPKTLNRKPIKPVSDAQAERKKTWAFIKVCFLEAQRKTDGHTSCMECGAVDPKPIDLDHIIPTGRGGEWTPKNAQVLCRACHSIKHGKPEWSKKEA